jgi:hypothetical protein
MPAFTEENIPASVLYTICFKKFGVEFHNWELETLWMEIQDEFGEDASDSNKDKIASALGLVTSNRFYEDFRVFESICKGLNGQSPNFEWVTPLTPEEVCWAMVEAKLIDSTPEDFAEEIRIYVRAILNENGIIKAPAQISFCKEPKKGNFPTPDATMQELKLKKIELYLEWQKEHFRKFLQKYLS